MTIVEALNTTPRDGWARSDVVAKAFLDDERVSKSITSILLKHNSIGLIKADEIKQNVYARIIELKLFDRITDINGIYSYLYRIAEITILNCLDEFLKNNRALSLESVIEDHDDESDRLSMLGTADDDESLSDDEVVQMQQSHEQATNRFARKLQNLGWSEQIPRHVDDYQRVGRPAGKKP